MQHCYRLSRPLHKYIFNTFIELGSALVGADVYGLPYPNARLGRIHIMHNVEETGVMIADGVLIAACVICQTVRSKTS